MKIICITDVHANLPALQAALKNIRDEGYDGLIHTGDAISIGPFPAECMELLLNMPRISFVMGNHDAYFVNGLPDSQASGMDKAELEHQHWTHSQLNQDFRQVMANWPYSIQEEYAGVRTAFVHYGLDTSRQDFVPIIKNPTPADLDQVFGQFDTDLVFYGHHHPFSDLQGYARYIDPGSLGCSITPAARYTVVTFESGHFIVEHRSVPYEDNLLVKAFRVRNVPAADLILRAFYGDRFLMKSE